ncbi:MAG: SpoIVB peptidase S55 domain-containing protein [Deltaproteobacteria bacterium]|nr:SpoIVB peptidase S55 domain-containing protein [Deltaproteobacteria bacterium]
MRDRHRLAWVAAFAASLLVSSVAQAAPGAEAEIFPLSQVQAGMEGYGLTVFSGTTPERFKVRVVSVLRNFMPKQDIILVQVEDERVKHSGVAAGMSGSPIYLQDRLAGALAYAWTFAKDPMAGITPIESMIEDSRRPMRAGRAESGVAKPATMSPLQPSIMPVALPLSFSGMDPQSVESMRAGLIELGLTPVAAASGGPDKKRAAMPVHLVPGGAVGVELVRGDMSAVATGTVTAIMGNTVLAFGHPMMGSGQVNLPMVGAEIHAILPSLASAFKIASPLGEVGAILQDRRTCIVGKLGSPTDRILVTVKVTAESGIVRPFSAEVARHERLTPMLVSMVVSSAVADAEPDPLDVMVDLRTRFEVKGLAPFEVREYVFSPTGFGARTVFGSHGLRALGTILGNNFAPADLVRVDLDAKIAFRKDVSQIVSARILGSPVRRGDTAKVAVTLRPFDGKDFVMPIEVKVPANISGDTVKVEIAAGEAVHPFVPSPKNLRELSENLKKFYPGNSMVVSLSRSEIGAAIRGTILSALPPAALDTLNPGLDTERPELHPVFDRTVFASTRVLSGKIELVVPLRDEPLGRVD